MEKKSSEVEGTIIEPVPETDPNGSTEEKGEEAEVRNRSTRKEGAHFNGARVHASV